MSKEGKKVAIGVGSAVVVGAAALALYRRSKNRASKAEQATAVTTPPAQPIGRLSALMRKFTPKP